MSKREKKAPRPEVSPTPLRARLRRAFCEATGSFCRMEAHGQRSLILQGCCGIVSYAPQRMVLRVRDPDVTCVQICGEALLCSSYHADGVEITGRIRTVEFL